MAAIKIKREGNMKIPNVFFRKSLSLQIKNR